MQEIECIPSVKHVMVAVSICSSLITLVKAFYPSSHLKLSLHVFLNCFLISA